MVARGGSAPLVSNPPPLILFSSYPGEVSDSCQICPRTPSHQVPPQPFPCLASCIPEGCAMVARGGSAPLVSQPTHFSLLFLVFLPQRGKR